ncbi:hypothetical protein PENANT_c009G08328 [Penicillium antarcticum]|uniref:Uncharacterized protein n=1 Tax=Penicillium antarcticum TaxID=416450 RepID=A0A1V6Q9L8_9EURO|nr:uncharacterized protein N7508_008964 [Penicillium antarcticum]KAJ5294143.1 hypothetical protein N7508_008964 [Penicillium antarcticum]OQD85672.1 hypothetical protein PENANT_c009G08328 [Penicillium antarcticum]
MPDKRKGDHLPPSPKRAKMSYDDHEDEGQYSPSHQERPRNNPTYGQKNAFPGLDDRDDGGDELFYGPAEDGLEYLRMVRSEANSLPSLFFKPKTVNTPEPTSDEQQHAKTAGKSKSFPRGFYADEAYIAPVEDMKPSAAANIDQHYPDAQNSYYILLRHRFLLLRSTLRCSPPAEAISALDHAHPISLPRNAWSAHKEWRRLLLAVDPNMVQLACMDSDSVLEVLELVARMMSDVVRSEDTERLRRIGAWAWGLLGKCREVGELSTEHVGTIRNLGKRAATIMRKIQETEKNRFQDEEDSELPESDLEDTPQLKMQDQYADERKEDELPVNAEVQDLSTIDASEQSQLEAAKARLQAQIQDSAGISKSTESFNEDLLTRTRSLLDMVITVVGEHYGQRDLLDAREIWT